MCYRDAEGDKLIMFYHSCEKKCIMSYVHTGVGMTGPQYPPQCPHLEQQQPDIVWYSWHPQMSNDDILSFCVLCAAGN